MARRITAGAPNLSTVAPSFVIATASPFSWPITPYHSKYNAIERVWGHLEQHWNGALLDALATVLAFARSFRFHQQAPTVRFILKLYATGARLTQKAMRLLERRLHRLPGLDKWFVRIPPLNYLTTVRLFSWIGLSFCIFAYLSLHFIVYKLLTSIAKLTFPQELPTISPCQCKMRANGQALGARNLHCRTRKTPRAVNPKRCLLFCSSF
jgi:hypothetical protein